MVKMRGDDPRVDIIGFGQIPKVSRFGDFAVRILAPNPSPMTLDGTNTYVLGSAQGAFIVDPGPSVDEHLKRVEEILLGERFDAKGILLTHGHIDHSEAAKSWSQHFDAPIYGANAFNGVRELSEGSQLAVGDLKVSVLATPGHTSDHIAFLTNDGALLTGDHVLGRGTSVVAHPDGNLSSYIRSILRLFDVEKRIALPGHGPEIVGESIDSVLSFYLGHRKARIMQLVAFLEGANADVHEIVEQLYGNSISNSLKFAAKLSTLAALSTLSDYGYVVEEGDRYQLASDSESFSFEKVFEIDSLD
ncbi:MAG: MBL fold metallo-hydrolase [Actinomycetota bacterium]|nr:MBL fold metallo-hydrolase [Actinomycetota bacterium]